MNVSFNDIDNRYARRFAKSIPWKTLPLYMGLTIVFAWLALLTALALEQKGANPQNHRTIFRVTRYTIYVYVATPFVYGVAGMLDEYLWGEPE